MFQVVEKIKATRSAFLSWHRTTFKSRQAELSQVRLKLNSIDCQPFLDSTLSERHALTQQLDSILAQDETYWRQRSKTSWMRDGDRNTKFFHRRALVR
ncbi:hypothetical protein ACFX19_017361 [Malus domestica]